jgi:hypothetical protein
MNFPRNYPKRSSQVTGEAVCASLFACQRHVCKGDDWVGDDMSSRLQPGAVLAVLIDVLLLNTRERLDAQQRGYQALLLLTSVRCQDSLTRRLRTCVIWMNEQNL